MAELDLNILMALQLHPKQLQRPSGCLTLDKFRRRPGSRRSVSGCTAIGAPLEGRGGAGMRL